MQICVIVVEYLRIPPNGTLSCLAGQIIFFIKLHFVAFFSMQFYTMIMEV